MLQVMGDFVMMTFLSATGLYASRDSFLYGTIIPYEMRTLQ